MGVKGVIGTLRVDVKFFFMVNWNNCFFHVAVKVQIYR